MTVLKEFIIVYPSLLVYLLLVVRACVAAPSINTNLRCFADKLTEDLYTDDRNECTSSWGVSLALSLVYPSAKGDTADQMRTVLHYPQAAAGSQVRKLVWNDAEARMTAKYQGQCIEAGSRGSECEQRAPLLSVANKVWVDNSTALNAPYAEVVGKFAASIDLSGSDAGETINAWVRNATNGLVDSIVLDGPQYNMLLAAINSIYLKAPWINPFQESDTNRDTFFTSAERNRATQSKALFMHKVGYFRYSHTVLEGFQVLQLPFSVSSLSMLVVLPLVAGNRRASSADVLGVLTDLEDTKVAVALPKFKFESKYGDALKRSLKATGLRLPFESFVSGLCVFDSSCGYIDSIIQKTALDVNDYGVEAAAVTFAPFVGVEPHEKEPILFLADHPFQFFIYDGEEDFVLFEGQVQNPGIANESAPAQFMAKHSDSDFWTASFGVDPTVLVVLNHNVSNSTSTGSEHLGRDNTASPVSADQSDADNSRSFRTVEALSLSFVVGLLFM